MKKEINLKTKNVISKDKLNSYENNGYIKNENNIYEIYEQLNIEYNLCKQKDSELCAKNYELVNKNKEYELNILKITNDCEKFKSL